jgi:hypothetical protein
VGFYPAAMPRPATAKRTAPALSKNGPMASTFVLVTDSTVEAARLFDRSLDIDAHVLDGS